jgi:hypothetical protein
MSRAKRIHDAVTKGLDEHSHSLNDERKPLRSVKVIVRMKPDGRIPDEVLVNTEYTKKIES